MESMSGLLQEQSDYVFINISMIDSSLKLDIVYEKILTTNFTFKDFFVI